MADWNAIKTEYITTNTSYRKLAKKYDIGYQAICLRSQEEGWIAMREQHRNNTVTKTIEKISKQEVARATRLQKVTDKMLSKIEAMVDAVNPKECDAKSLRALSAALKDIKEIQGVRSDLDRQEQQARIDNLRKQADKDENTDAPTLVVEGLPEEFKV